MSQVQIAGNASGTGVFQIAAPNSNTNRTLTLPDNTGTLISTGSSGQVIPRAALPVGSVIQVANFQTGTLATGTTAIPYDNTIPQITEGDQFMSLAFTPTSATSKLFIQVVWMGTNTSQASAGFCVALFQVGTANALAAAFNSQPNSSIANIPLNYYVTAGTTSTITFTVRAGSGNGGTTSFNGQSGSQLGGGSMASSITIEEIAA